MDPEGFPLLNHVEEGKTIKGSGHRILNLLHQTDAVSSIMTCLQSSVVPSVQFLMFQTTSVRQDGNC